MLLRHVFNHQINRFKGNNLSHFAILQGRRRRSYNVEKKTEIEEIKKDMSFTPIKAQRDVKSDTLIESDIGKHNNPNNLPRKMMRYFMGLAAASILFVVVGAINNKLAERDGIVRSVILFILIV
jgi:hypothetical protein